nr:hypothetical protein [uncultured Desulfobacter sp.]
MKLKSIIFNNRRFNTIRLIFGKTRIGYAFILGLMALWLTACAGVDSKPFETFNELATALSKEDVIKNRATNLGEKEKDFWMSKNSKDAKKISGLFLTFDSDSDFSHGFSFGEHEMPDFIKWGQFQSGILELNQGFIDYTNLLVTLAGGDLIQTEAFNKLTEDLNNNVRDALLAINPPKQGEDGPPEETLAFFATVTGETARNLIEYKRKERLIEVITNNQVKVDNILKYGKGGIFIMAGNVKSFYESYVHRVRKTLPGMSDSERRTEAEAIYAESIVTGSTLNLLKGLAETYDSLSLAHRQLPASLDNDQISFRALAANIIRLRTLNDELRKANEVVEKQRQQAAN